MPLADVAVGCLVLAHRGDPDAVLENGFADGQWCEECAHVVIIKGLWKEKTPPFLTGLFAVLMKASPLTKWEKFSECRLAGLGFFLKERWHRNV